IPCAHIRRRLGGAAVTMRGGVAVFAALMTITGTASAQPPRGRLAGAKSLDCRFTTQASGVWKNGAPQADTKAATLSLQFEDIDTEEGTARVIGLFGPSDIIVRVSDETLHLIQSFRQGPLYATTVFAKETQSGRFQAVHSRHEWTPI